MTPLSRVRHVYRRQFGVLTLADLARAGFSVEAVRHLVRSGRLKRFHRGVYVVVDWPFSTEQIAYAGVAASPAGAALSHLSAASHLRLLSDWPSQPEVTTPGTSGTRGPRLVRLHHSRTLKPTDTWTYNGIHTTTVARTLDDIARRRAPPSLKAAVRAAEFEHRIDLATLDPSSAALRRLLELYVPIDLSQSELEALFLDMCATHDIPRPQCQYEVAPYFADFTWHDVGLIVETDGRRAHEGWMARQHDIVKDRHLKARTGYEVVHFTYAEVVRGPAPVAAEIRETRSRLRA